MVLNAGARGTGLFTMRGGGPGAAAAGVTRAVASHACAEHVGGVGTCGVCVEGRLRHTAQGLWMRAKWS